MGRRGRPRRGAAGHRTPGLARADVERIVAGASEPRHQLENSMVRAVHGHSVPDRIGYTAATPPAVLFHGTTTVAAAQVLVEGLMPMPRQYVHRSADRDVAVTVTVTVTVGARRQAQPVFLTVDAARPAAEGLWFADPDDQLWLAEAVPAPYLAR